MIDRAIAILGTVLGCAAAITGLLIGGYLLFFLAPISAHVDKLCLENGFPRSAITWNGDGYCLNLEGTVTVKVEKLK